MVLQIGNMMELQLIQKWDSGMDSMIQICMTNITNSNVPSNMSTLNSTTNTQMKTVGIFS